MDHHCDVFDRCIAGKNLCLFYTVIGSFFVLLAYLMIMMISQGDIYEDKGER